MDNPLQGTTSWYITLNSRFRGVRFSFAGRDAIYALAQTPLYQDVNALQLTAKINYVI